MRFKTNLLPLCTSLIVLGAASFTAHADTSKEILIEAVKTGHASAELTGDQADVWKAKTHSREPVMVEAKVVEQLQQPGCARVAIQFTQQEVPKVNGGSGPLEVGWGMNVCEDGSPPADPSLFTQDPHSPTKVNKVQSQ
ncbi:MULTISPECIES: hypothetical protein [Pseudomonas]|uniref:Secreted protein n=3 Tax=Pseudomonas TaxID=286 RepID=A0A3G1DGP3_PSEAI|nr:MULTISPECIES: hypothetical protein [Pseudomonas]MCO6692590.1 hypothetical protein [Pseudomonas shirazica]AMP36001.1 Hypothetical protein [Pseudomonas aeruginosa]KIC81553.1 hypothetical protein RR51_15640 [Pseudomonas sp. C5pp]MBA6092376.1 hypothetical protein [Pseudomonas monteilii]MCE0756881.1 hypothetical protein [Pseudomonas asiatica]